MRSPPTEPALSCSRAAAAQCGCLLRLQVLNFLGSRWKKRGKACMKPEQAEAVLGHAAFNDHAAVLAAKFVGKLKARNDHGLPPAEE